MKLKELGGAGRAHGPPPHPLPPPPSALRPQKDSPIYLTARTLGVGPQDRCSTAISQELCVAAANAVLPRREVHQASV